MIQVSFLLPVDGGASVAQIGLDRVMVIDKSNLDQVRELLGQTDQPFRPDRLQVHHSFFFRPYTVGCWDLVLLDSSNSRWYRTRTITGDRYLVGCHRAAGHLFHTSARHGQTSKRNEQSLDYVYRGASTSTLTKPTPLGRGTALAIPNPHYHQNPPHFW